MSKVYKILINNIDYTKKVDFKSISYSQEIDSYDFSFDILLTNKEELKALKDLQMAEVLFLIDGALEVGGVLWDIKQNISPTKSTGKFSNFIKASCTTNSYSYLTSKILTDGGPADINVPDFSDNSTNVYFSIGPINARNAEIPHANTETASESNTIDKKSITIQWPEDENRAQKAYRVIVEDEKTKTVYDSTKIYSQVTEIDVELAVNKRYTIKITTFDEYDKENLVMYSEFIPDIQRPQAARSIRSENGDVTVNAPINNSVLPVTDVSLPVSWSISAGIRQNAYKIDVYNKATGALVMSTNKTASASKSTILNISGLAKNTSFYLIVNVYFEENVDLNSAENIFYRYAQTYLKPKNIRVSKLNIQTNLIIGEISDEDLDPKPYLKDVLDYIADKTNSSWFITMDKVFKVRTGRTINKTLNNRFSEVVSGNEPLGELIFDVNMEKTGEDIVNRITVIGSATNNCTDAKYLDEEGRLHIVVNNLEAQAKMRTVGLGDGILEKIEENDKIETVEELQRFADEFVAKYGEGLEKITFSTYSDIDFNAGDFIGLNIPSLQLQNKLCMVDSIEYNFVSYMQESNAFRKDIECTIRKDNNPLPNWTSMFKNNNQTSSKKPGNKPQPGLTSDSIDIQMLENVITDVRIEIVKKGA